MWWWWSACGIGSAVPEPSPTEVPAPAPASAPTAGGGGAPEVFGAYPLCEPSAAIPLDDGSFLVADNEGRPADPKERQDARPTLWIARADQAPVPVSRTEVAQDAESLARVGDELWVLGSLSRNKDCEVRGKRWEIHVSRPKAFTAEGLRSLETVRILERKKSEIAEIEGSEEGCRRLLFGGLPEAGPVCRAMVEAAKSLQGGPCAALNVEGAAVVSGRVWVGLRAPLVEGRAVLARLAPGHQALAFDAVRELDLGGLGIRELVVEGDRLYGIAGTELDPTGDARSALFSVPLSGLETGELPVEIHDPALPPSAESLLFRDGRIEYLLDGQSSKEAAGRCEQPARREIRPRPS